MRTAAALIVASTLMIISPGPSAHAQKITGTPGSPDVTTTIDGRVLPPPAQPFRGQIQRNATQSTLA